MTRTILISLSIGCAASPSAVPGHGGPGYPGNQGNQGGRAADQGEPLAPATVGSTRSPKEGAPAPNAGVSPGAGEVLSLTQAQALMIDLVNRDRQSQGLAPVAFDGGAPSRAAERHARDMAQSAFLGHWGLDGSVPESRLTEAGGVDMVLENALCLVDERKRAIEGVQTFSRAQIIEAERMFFEELPPNDGHRQNILKPWHTHVGIGLVMVRPGPNEIVFPCVVQEFIDRYGEHAAIPRKLAPGASLHLESTLAAGIAGGAVGLVKLPPVEMLPVKIANTRRSYPVPEPEETFWPKGFKTRLPVQLSGQVATGQKLTFDLPMGKTPGLYEVSIWARLPGHKDYRMVSLRTVTVE
jgi:uncharacterized protein YkwD